MTPWPANEVPRLDFGAPQSGSPGHFDSKAATAHWTTGSEQERNNDTMVPQKLQPQSLKVMACAERINTISKW